MIAKSLASGPNRPPEENQNFGMRVANVAKFVDFRHVDKNNYIYSKLKIIYVKISYLISYLILLKNKV